MREKQNNSPLEAKVLNYDFLRLRLLRLLQDADWNINLALDHVGELIDRNILNENDFDVDI